MATSIVLADDDPDLRAVYSTSLRSAGYEVWEAADGIEAVALVGSKRPTILILDVWMPNLNGFEVLERLRHDPRSTNLKVVMLSALNDSDTRLESFSIGVADYWLKGLSLTELQARVGRLVASSEAEFAPDLAS
ncbi:response regulator [Singulisphaera rosea]